MSSRQRHLALASLGRLTLAVGLVATVVALALGLGVAVVGVGGLSALVSMITLGYMSK